MNAKRLRPWLPFLLQATAVAVLAAWQVVRTVRTRPAEAPPTEASPSTSAPWIEDDMVVEGTLRVIRHASHVLADGTPWKGFTEYRVVDAAWVDREGRLLV